uniref:Uncharacterized protein n=1 Tax=Cannabis sativa TaxID=3483 RepID=A0A803R8S3_CANSA
MNHLLDFIKRDKLTTQTFTIAHNQCMYMLLHQSMRGGSVEGASTHQSLLVKVPLLCKQQPLSWLACMMVLWHPHLVLW